MTSPTALDLLFISSDYPTLKTVRTGLEQLGATLSCMPTIEAARGYVGRRKVDGIILDLEVANALEFIAFIQQGTSNRHAVIFACARNTLESTAARRAGAHVLLQKPLTVENVVSKITAAQELMTRERRRYFRQPIFLPVVVKWRGKEQRATTTNISEGGMALRVANASECPSLLDFSFELPLGPIVSGRGHVAWANEEGGIGITFQLLRGTGKDDLVMWLANRERISPQSTA